MIKIFKVLCLAVLCMHNQLFAGEVARALGAFDAQLRQLTKMLEESEIAAEAKAAWELALQQELSEDRQAFEKGVEEKIDTMTQMIRKSIEALAPGAAGSFRKSYTLLSKDQGFLSDLGKRAELKESEARDMLAKGLIKKQWAVWKRADVGKRKDAKALAEAQSVEAVADREIAESRNALVDVMIQQAEKNAEADLVKYGKIPVASQKRFISRGKAVAETTGLYNELVGLVTQYELPAFSGIKEKEFSVFSEAELRHYGRDERPVHIAVLPHNRMGVALASGSRTDLVLVDVAAPRANRRIPDAHSFGISALAVSPAGDLISCADDNQTGMIKIWDGRTGRLQESFSVATTAPAEFDYEQASNRYASLPRAVAFVGDTLLYGSLNGIFARVGGTRTWRKVSSRACRSNLLALGDGRLAFASDRALVVIDPVTGNVVEFASMALDSTCIALCPDGNVVVARSGKDFALIKIWDIRSENQEAAQKTLEVIRAPDAITALIVLPDGRIVHNGGKGHSVTIVDPETGETRLLEEGVEGRSARALAVMNPEDDARLVVGYENGMVAIWR